MARSLTKKKRFRIFKRDNFTCMYCGRRPPHVTLEVDHIKPVCEGGTDDLANLITSCFECNRGKSGESLSVIPASLAEIQARRLEALEQAEELHKAERRAAKRAAADVDELEMEFSVSFSAPARRSVMMFIQKLGLNEVAEAMAITAGKMNITSTTGFRYFCGICWNKIRDREGAR